MAEKKEELSLATRFTNAVVSAYTDVAQGIEVNERERGLIANYFVEIDTALANSKQGYTWNDIKMRELSLSVAHLARLNLDMKMNHVSFIPFRDGKTGKVNMVSCISSKGWEWIAKAYSIEPIKNVIVELVYSTDTFSIIKKDANHPCDSYMFEVGNPFNRGEIIGAFAYAEFEDASLNKLLTMSLQQILALKPSRADDTFWGKNSPHYTKMLEKTIAKQLMKKIALDPNKVNGVRSSFDYMQNEELVGASLSAQEEISEKNGNGELIDFDTPDTQIEAIDVEFTPVDEVVGNIVDKLENGVLSGEQDSLFGEPREDWRDDI